jgi:hypothetical protein
MITKSTFYRYQTVYLFPIVNSAWEDEQHSIHGELYDMDIYVCGDGRCDSPGHSAKYCTYTFMDNATNKILHFSMKQCGPDLKSANMEKVALIDCLEYMEEKELTISILATDRHASIAKMMRTSYPDIDHQYDVWHMAKSISKKLRKKTEKKCNRPIGPWIKAVVNHLWFSSASCDGDPDVLREIWSSIIFHVQDIHEWADKTHFHACNHPPLTDDESRRKKWIEPNSPALEAFASVILDKLIMKDIGKLSCFSHTGNLESYHSEMIRYMPKNKYFSYQGMICRTQLCAMDHNIHVNREQIVNRSGPRVGLPRYSHSCPKGRDHWIAKKVKETKTYPHLPKLCCTVVESVISGKKPCPLTKPDLPARITGVERPSLDESLKYSRFTSEASDDW